MNIHDFEPYIGPDSFVFVSFSPKDADQACRAIQVLESEGIHYWYNREASTAWNGERILQCEAMITILSDAYVHSGPCLDEIAYASDQQKRILCVYAEECALPEIILQFLGKTQSFAVDINDPAFEQKLVQITTSDPGIDKLNNPSAGCANDPDKARPSDHLKKTEGSSAYSSHTPEYTIHLNSWSKNRCIRFYYGDLTETDQAYDIVCCSAFKGDYVPVSHSLIGALWKKKNISVRDLSISPEMDMRNLGGWLSRPVNSQFKRILCIELMDLFDDSAPSNLSLTLKSAFLTLRNLLERASLQGIEIHRIALPILGAGYQDIDLDYIASPLFTQCVNMFQTISSLETIDFYELNYKKLHHLISVCKEITEKSSTIAPSVFISYSSAQTDFAHSIWKEMQANRIETWIAPESIPTGSNYISEIPRAISSIRMLLLLLTEDAQQSKWVQKEVGSAIGSGKLILPIQVYPFALSPELRFMLEGEQIYFLWEDENERRIPAILREVKQKLQEEA